MEISEGIQVKIKRQEVLRLQGCKDVRLRPPVEDALTKGIEEGYRLIAPKAIFTQVKIEEITDDSIVLDGGLTLNTANATRAWEGSEYLGIAICTINSPLEDRVTELFANGEYPSALMLDSVGSVAIESAADYINSLLCRRAMTQDAETGPRLSPGYGSWELTDQRLLFDLLPADEIGVHLNDTCMMLPRKSISFCVGIGRGLSTQPRMNSCEHCGLDDCPYRRQLP